MNLLTLLGLHWTAPDRPPLRRKTLGEALSPMSEAAYQRQVEAMWDASGEVVRDQDIPYRKIPVDKGG